MIGARAVARQLAEIEVKREQRRQQIVLEKCCAQWRRMRRGTDAGEIEQVEECLVRIERGGDEVPGADHLAVGRFDPDRATALDQDALGFGRWPDLAARFAHRTFERARQRRQPPRDVCAFCCCVTSTSFSSVCSLIHRYSNGVTRQAWDEIRPLFTRGGLGVAGVRTALREPRDFVPTSPRRTPTCWSRPRTDRWSSFVDADHATGKDHDLELVRMAAPMATSIGEHRRRREHQALRPLPRRRRAGRRRVEVHASPVPSPLHRAAERSPGIRSPSRRRRSR